MTNDKYLIIKHVHYDPRFRPTMPTRLVIRNTDTGEESTFVRVSKLTLREALAEEEGS